MAVCELIHAEVTRVEDELQKLLAIRNALRRAAGLFAQIPDDVASLLPSLPAVPTASDLLGAAQACPWLAALLPPGFTASSPLPLSLLRTLRTALQAQITAALRGPIGRGVRLFQMGVTALAPVGVFLGQLQTLEQCLTGVCNQVGRYAYWLGEFPVDALGNPLIASSEAAQQKAAQAKAVLDQARSAVEAWG